MPSIDHTLCTFDGLALDPLECQRNVNIDKRRGVVKTPDSDGKGSGQRIAGHLPKLKADRGWLNAPSSMHQTSQAAPANHPRMGDDVIDARQG